MKRGFFQQWSDAPTGKDESIQLFGINAMAYVNGLNWH